MDVPFEPDEISRRLLAWYGQHGRDLPWRHTRDPYRIWLSEVMLQQTTVTAVVPYYEKFLKVFPDVNALARAPLEKVLELWAGLGYYSRARNLHSTAQQVSRQLSGKFPETVEGLMQLPGIGRSTAGAIVSIAFDSPAPILDGNVRRVLARLTALREPPRERQAEKELWGWATACTPEEQPHEYAQAIMDLGATVCLPRQPLCTDCPLAGICQAKICGLEKEIPVKSPKVKIPDRREVALVLQDNGKLLVQRRPPKGLLGGMWEFPNRAVSEVENPVEVMKGMRHDFGLKQPAECFGTVKHVYSHFRLEVTIYMIAAQSQEYIYEREESFWCEAEKLKSGPIHGAHLKVLKRVMRESD